MGSSLDEKHVMKTVWNEHSSQRWNERQNLSCLLMAMAAARDLLSFKTLGLENRRGRGNRITAYSNVTSQCLLYRVINSLQTLSYLCYCPLNSNPSFQHCQRYLSTTCLSHLPMKTLLGLREKPSLLSWMYKDLSLSLIQPLNFSSCHSPTLYYLYVHKLSKKQ